MYKSQSEILVHMKKETQFLLESKQNKNFEKLLNDEIWKRAVVRSLEIIGEASKKIDEDFKMQHTNIQWKSMAKMRDKLIHDYFGVDFEIVWDVHENKIEELDYQLQLILESFNDEK
jgi:uncharacterized protein with HEPN domain